MSTGVEPISAFPKVINVTTLMTVAIIAMKSMDVRNRF